METNKSFPVYPTDRQRLLDAQGTTHYESPVLGAALGIWCLQLHLTPLPQVRHTQPALTPLLCGSETKATWEMNGRESKLALCPGLRVLLKAC